MNVKFSFLWRPPTNLIHPLAQSCNTTVQRNFPDHLNSQSCGDLVNLRVPIMPMIQIRCKWGILFYCNFIQLKEHILKARIFPQSIMPKTHQYTNSINKLVILAKDISFASDTFQKAYPMWTSYHLWWPTRLINVLIWP